MGDGRRKKVRRRDAVKPTAKLPALPPPSDKAVAGKQRAFCTRVVDKLLEDESALSFSKPVNELWDMSELEDYFDKIKNPMDLGTVRTRLLAEDSYVDKESGLFDANAFRYEVRLVFLNALDYNEWGTPLAELSTKFLQFIDSELADLPGQPAPAPAQASAPAPHPTKDSPVVTPQSADRSKDKDDGVRSDKAGSSNGRSEKGLAQASGTADPGAQEADDEERRQDEEMKDEPNENGKGASVNDEEVEKLKDQISALQKDRARSESQLAELELVRNLPLTHDENVKLRDEVEAMPWETAKKVVKILREYVNEALVDCKEKDPEFVTLEFSTVEPRLLRDIESLIRPDPRVEKERQTISALDEEISAVQRKLRKIGPRDAGVKKKARRRR